MNIQTVRTPRFPFFLAVSAAALILANAPLHASDMDDKIEAAASKSYVFRTYLKDDMIKADAKDGEVTLDSLGAATSTKHPPGGPQPPTLEEEAEQIAL